jgi:hypothetical protein
MIGGVRPEADQKWTRPLIEDRIMDKYDQQYSKVSAHLSPGTSSVIGDDR